MDHRKKKFKKVLFRLPTAKEWEFLAKSGKGNIVNYPWGDKQIKDFPNRDYDQHITNSRGCFLANIDAWTVANNPVSDEKCPAADKEKGSSLDGGIFPVQASAYSPNYFGLYGTIGNVAEMVIEKGIAKGGSWNSSVKTAKIGEQETYSGPSPEIGFRVIMVILEE